MCESASTPTSAAQEFRVTESQRRRGRGSEDAWTETGCLADENILHSLGINKSDSYPIFFTFLYELSFNSMCGVLPSSQ